MPSTGVLERMNNRHFYAKICLIGAKRGVEVVFCLHNRTSAQAAILLRLHDYPKNVCNRAGSFAPISANGVACGFPQYSYSPPRFTVDGLASPILMAEISRVSALPASEEKFRSVELWSLVEGRQGKIPAGLLST